MNEPSEYQERAASQALGEGLCIQCNDAVHLCPKCARCRICGHQPWCERSVDVEP